MINIYKASAGSGKTYTLTLEYIKLILGERQDDGTYRLALRSRNRHRAILAITFTNKATEEMKNRIIHELAVLARREPGWTEPSGYAPTLTALFGCTEVELCERAGMALDDLLHDFNYFNVSTIDAFFQTVLRAFAREAEIDGNYELELEDKLVISLGVNELLSSLRTRSSRENSYLLSWLETYMTEKVEQGSTFNIFNRSARLHKELIDFFSKITGETFVDIRDTVMDYLADPSRLVRFEKAIADRVRDRLDLISKSCIEALKLIDDRGLEDAGLLNKNTLGLLRKFVSASASKLKDTGKTCAKIIENVEAAYLKSRLGSPLRDSMLDALIQSACIEIDAGKDIALLELLRRNLFHLGLLKRLDECVSIYRAENSTILLSDTNAIINRIIKDETDTPFLYERLGERLEHFLIDEFQDTSELQWKNLRPLISNSLAYGHDNLIIGDEKQCIYRFRNSEPELLRNLHAEFPGRNHMSGNNPGENTNWRSSADVVRFNNTLFTALASVTGNSSLYNNVVQLVANKHRDHTGYVKIRNFNEPDTALQREQILDFMTAELVSAIADGYRPCDIAILVRTLKDGTDIVNHLLRRQAEDGILNDVRIVSDKSIYISQSPAVRLIISVLRYVTSNDDVSSSRKKSRRDVARLLNRFEYFRSRNADSSSALYEALHSPESIEEIAGSALTVNCLNLPTVVERIIRRYLPEAERHSENLFLCSFQDIVNDYIRNNSGDIRSFLQWWDEKGCRTAVAGVADEKSLSILTIHKAKGLEFKVAMVPFAGRKSVTVDEIKWFQTPQIEGIPAEITPKFIPLTCTSAMENTPFAAGYQKLKDEFVTDELNVLYVALTRAVDRLIVGLPSHPKIRYVADYVREAIDVITPGFVSELNEVSGVDKHSRFIAMSFDSNGEIEIGRKLPPRSEEKKPDTALTPLTGSMMPDYWSDDRNDLWDGTRVDNVSRYDFGLARKRGIILHDLLARLHSADEVDVTVTKMIREGLIPPSEADNIRLQISEMMQDPHAAMWFGNPARVLIERTLTADSEILRPDRVVWTREGTVDVIDYKTGKGNHSANIRQVKKYVDKLRDMGYDNVRGFLWYLDSAEILRCV